MSKLDPRDVIAMVLARVKRVLDLVELVVPTDKFERFDVLTAELETLGKRIKDAERTDAAERSAQADTVITVCQFDVPMARNQVVAMPQ
jgi:hypothetical protein